MRWVWVGTEWHLEGVHEEVAVFSSQPHDSWVALREAREVLAPPRSPFLELNCWTAEQAMRSAERAWLPDLVLLGYPDGIPVEPRRDR